MTTRAVRLVPEVATSPALSRGIEMLKLGYGGKSLSFQTDELAALLTALAAVPAKYARLREAEVRVIGATRRLAFRCLDDDAKALAGDVLDALAALRAAEKEVEG